MVDGAPKAWVVSRCELKVLIYASWFEQKRGESLRQADLSSATQKIKTCCQTVVVPEKRNAFQRVGHPALSLYSSLFIWVCFKKVHPPSLPTLFLSFAPRFSSSVFVPSLNQDVISKWQGERCRCRLPCKCPWCQRELHTLTVIFSLHIR